MIELDRTLMVGCKRIVILALFLVFTDQNEAGSGRPLEEDE